MYVEWLAIGFLIDVPTLRYVFLWVSLFLYAIGLKYPYTSFDKNFSNWQIEYILNRIE